MKKKHKTVTRDNLILTYTLILLMMMMIPHLQKVIPPRRRRSMPRLSPPRCPRRASSHTRECERRIPPAVSSPFPGLFPLSPPLRTDMEGNRRIAVPRQASYWGGKLPSGRFLAVEVVDPAQSTQPRRQTGSTHRGECARNR